MFKIYNWWDKKKFLAEQIVENCEDDDLQYIRLRVLKNRNHNGRFYSTKVLKNSLANFNKGEILFDHVPVNDEEIVLNYSVKDMKIV